MSIVTNTPAEVYVDGEWLQVQQHRREPGGFLSFQIGVSSMLIHESRADRVRMLPDGAQPPAEKPSELEAYRRAEAARAKAVADMQRKGEQHTENPDHGEHEAPKPAAVHPEA